MSGKLKLVLSIILLVLCVLAIFSFVVLSIGGENMNKYIPALILSIIIVISCLFDIFGRKK